MTIGGTVGFPKPQNLFTVHFCVEGSGHFPRFRSGKIPTIILIPIRYECLSFFNDHPQKHAPKSQFT